ncbi:Inner membrane protein YbjJ [Frondihabitans sp. 762G35]|nr:Inner membrane protein YbjJ [Frondihabitans sp. 762G35]
MASVNDHGTSTTTPARASTAAWRNAVLVLFALGGVAVSTWGPRLPSIRQSLDIGDGAIGLALAGVTVGSIAGLAASSALLAGLGNRRAVLGALGAGAAGVALVGVAAGLLQSLPLTAVGFVLVGFGIGAVDVMINVEGAAVEKAAARTLMPLMHAGWSAGAIAGAGIGAACAALDVDFAWQFLAEAVLIAVAASVAVAFLPQATAVAEEAAKPPVRERVRAWASGWRESRLLLIGLVMLGVELGEGTANSWLTLAVHDGHGQPQTIAPLFFVAFAAGETVARVCGGPLVDRIGRVRTVRVTTALGVVGLVLFIAGGPGWVVLVGTVLWAVGVSMGFPLGMSAAADSGPNPAARVSVVASIGYLANLGGPPLVGALSDRLGILGALWLVVALLVVGFAAAGALRAPRAAQRA